MQTDTLIFTPPYFYNTCTTMKKLLLAGFCFLWVNGLMAQQIFDSLLTELNTKYPQEKIYIHTDKSFYNPGETIWMKAYIKSDNFPTAISTNIYAELIDEKNKLVNRKIMPVTLLGAQFDFDIPDSCKSTRMYIRAYSSWMLNFNDVYTRAINIIQPHAPNQMNKRSYTLNFFPEGGDLVSDIESRIAFKVHDNDGKPISIKGEILNDQAKPIQTFSTVHNGMGTFVLKPESTKQYKARWTDPDGMLHETLLPKSKNEGATLSIIHQNDQLLYTIKRPMEVSDAFKEYSIIAQMNQQIVYAAKINFKVKTQVSAPIPIDSLSEGILQLTLFNKNLQPIAERIIYVDANPIQFITDVKLTEKNLSARGKNQLQIDVGGNLNSNISIAITDDIQSPALPYSPNILSEFLMSADLRGSIYQPGYYFSNSSDSVKQHLDLVMMTHGWRRFKWEDILSGKWPHIMHLPDNYLSIEGNIYGLTAAELEGQSISGLIKSGKDIESSPFIYMEADKRGFVKADKFFFFDTVRLFYQINNDKKKRLTDKASFSFRNGFIPSAPIAPPLGLYYHQLSTSEAIINANHFSILKKEEQEKLKIKMMENITVKGTLKTAEEKMDEAYASGLFSSGNSRIFAVENDPLAGSYQNVLQYLQGKVAGLQISIEGFEGTVSRRGSPTSLFLNEMQAESDLILSTPMSDVAMIKVFDPPFVGAMGGGPGGAIAVYTKKGASTYSQARGLNVALIHGYSKFKELYSPNYETTPSTGADYRSTLYWNPTLFFGSKNKRIVIPFFNNSSARKIRVILEGINEKGQITREEKVFE